MELNKDDWIQWKNLPAYAAFEDALREIGGELVSYLSKKAGIDPLEDRRVVGNLQGIQWLLDWEPDFIEEGDKNDAEDHGTPAAY